MASETGESGLGISVFDLYEEVQPGGKAGGAAAAESVVDIIKGAIIASGAEPSDFDSNLFQTVGRYEEIVRLAPHLDPDVRKKLFAAFRARVEAVIHERVLAVRPRPPEFDPLQIRKHCHVRARDRDFGICGVGHLEWTEQQREYLFAVYDCIVDLAKLEVEGGGPGNRGRLSGGPRALGASCMIVPKSWREQLEAEVKKLKAKFGAEADGVDEVLRKRQAFMKALTAEERPDSAPSTADSADDEAEIISPAQESGPSCKSESGLGPARESPPSEAVSTAASVTDLLDTSFGAEDALTLRDLMRVTDHLHVLLPDLARRLMQHFNDSGVTDIPLIARVAPRVSQQYRGEQTDLFLLENMRRVQFEPEEMFADLKKQLTGGEDIDGLVMASCLPGCRCSR